MVNGRGDGNVCERDLIVVGGGIAGSVAACRAADLGLSVLLLDVAADPTAGGNTSLSGGGIHIARLGLDADPGRLRRRILWGPVGVVREHLADRIVATAAEAFAWFSDQGVAFEPAAPGDIQAMLAPLRDLGDVHAWPGRGPQMMLRTLQSRCTAGGGEVLGGLRARELVQRNGAVTGIVTDDGRTYPARAVLLADGGYQANLALRRRFIGPSADRIFLRGAPHGQGDGLLMGEAVGAALSNTEFFYGHCMHGDVVRNDRLWPWPALDEILTEGGVLVDRTARRLTDEGIGGVNAANVVARLADPLSTFVLLDERLWAEAGELVWGHLSTNPELERRGGTIHRGASPAEVAAAAGIDPDGLADTVAAYNTALAAGQGGTLPIPRTGKAAPLAGSLLAMPMIPGISHSTGGLVIDDGSAVLDGEGRRIPGLFAAGPVATAPHAGYYGGMATALVQAYVGATEVAALKSTLAV